MSPHDRFRLERKLLDIGAQIVGIHSLAVEGNTALVIYDIIPDPEGNGLHFNFDLPCSRGNCASSDLRGGPS